MAKTRYEIQISRRAAAMYLSWEFGHANAVKMMAATRPDSNVGGFVRLPARGFYTATGRHSTRRAAETTAQHIKTVVAFQQGRLGLPLSDGGGVYVREIQ